MVTHKLRDNSNEICGFSECGKALHLTGGSGSVNWKDVDCKHCLKHRGKK